MTTFNNDNSIEFENSNNNNEYKILACVQLAEKDGELFIFTESLSEDNKVLNNFRNPVNVRKSLNNLCQAVTSGMTQVLPAIAALATKAAVVYETLGRTDVYETANVADIVKGVVADLPTVLSQRRIDKVIKGVEKTYVDMAKDLGEIEVDVLDEVIQGLAEELELEVSVV